MRKHHRSGFWHCRTGAYVGVSARYFQVAPGRFFDARERMGGALRRRPPQRSEDEKSITASAVIIPHPAKPKTTPLKTLQELLCAVGVVTTRR